MAFSYRLFSPYRSAEGPPGPFSMPRGPATERRVPWPPVRGPDGATHIGGGAGRRLPVVEESAPDYLLCAQ